MAGVSDPNGRLIGKPFRPFSSYLPPEFKLAKDGDSYSLIMPDSFDPLHPDIDLKWAGKTDDTNKFNNYYDYFFTGEDVKVYIDGLFDPGDELEIASFAFNITQQKAPLYGFWSYNYDVMMTGTRIVSGEMIVYTRYPGRMRDLLSKAADVRASFYSNQPASQMQSYLRSDKEGEEDDKNIQKYWANSQLDRLSSDQSKGSDDRNIFSAHPPFNLVVKYGSQEGSLTTVARNKGTSSDQNYDMLDRLMSLDFNDRLSQKNITPMDIILQSIHLTSMSTAYQPGGNPLLESYQFIARDMYISDGTRKNPPNAQVAINEEEQIKKTPTNTVPDELTELELTTRKDLARLYDL
jgi:hypothetical protein